MPSSRQGTASESQGTEVQGKSFSSFLLPVLSAIGTGIGVLGFVVFFGGFILWSRFKAAGLPANEAVAKVPRSEMVATGASFLVPGVLVALGVVAFALAIWDIRFGSPRRHRREEAEDERDEATEQLADLEEEQQQLESFVAGASRAEAASIKRRLTELTRREIPALRRARREATERIKPERLDLSERWTQVLIGLVPLAAVLAYLFLQGGLSCGYVVLLLVAAVLLGAVAVVVVSMTDHFAWYALCIFLGVGVMIAAFNYVRTQTDPKVSPVAALSGSSPVVGFFVAETSDAVYVGRPQPAGPEVEADSTGFDRERSTLVRVPKNSVADLTVGPLMDVDVAYRRSLQLAMALCRRAKAAADEAAARAAAAKGEKKEADQKTTPPQPVRCSKNEERLLENRLASASGQQS